MVLQSKSKIDTLKRLEYPEVLYLSRLFVLELFLCTVIFVRSVIFARVCVCTYIYSSPDGEAQLAFPRVFCFWCQSNWVLVSNICLHTLGQGAEFLWPSLCVQRFLHEDKSVRVWEREKERESMSAGG